MVEAIERSVHEGTVGVDDMMKEEDDEIDEFRRCLVNSVLLSPISAA